MPKIAGLAGFADSDALAARSETVEAFLLRKSFSGPPEAAEASDRLLQHISEHIAPRIRDGWELYQELQFTARLLPTGCSSLDELLRGGYREGQVTELWGPSASGKTQLCLLAAAVTAARDEQVVYLDSTASCSPTRLAAMCQSLEGQAPMDGRQAMAALERIQVVRVHSVHDALAVLDSLVASLQGQAGREALPRTSMLVLDSASSIVAPVLGADGPSSLGHVLMTLLAQQLRALAQTCMLAVIITNHTVGGGRNHQDARPALGETWRAQPHVRLQLCIPNETGQPTDQLTIPSSRSSLQWGESAPGTSAGPEECTRRSVSISACTFAAAGAAAAFRITGTGICSS